MKAYHSKRTIAHSLDYLLAKEQVSDPTIHRKMKTSFVLTLAALGRIAIARGAVIEVADFSLTPDGTDANPIQISDLATPNEGNVLSMSGSTVYFVTTFTFGADSDAHLETQFLAGNGAGRIGILIQDNGNVAVPGTGGQLVDYDGLIAEPSPSSYRFDQDMAGQTVIILAKLQFDSSNNTTYNVRFGNGNSHDSADTLANFWINPTGASLEGSGPSAGDLYAIWNSAGFGSFEQQIYNQSTPETAGTSSITNTVVLTGDDATFANALALATETTTPDLPVSLTITPNPSLAGSFDFSWQAKAGKLYDLVSSLDLTAAPETWEIWDGRSGIAGTELIGVPGGTDEKRFFALVEQDAS